MCLYKWILMHIWACKGTFLKKNSVFLRSAMQLDTNEDVRVASGGTAFFCLFSREDITSWTTILSSVKLQQARLCRKWNKENVLRQQFRPLCKQLCKQLDNFQDFSLSDSVCGYLLYTHIHIYIFTYVFHLGQKGRAAIQYYWIVFYLSWELRCVFNC